MSQPSQLNIYFVLPEERKDAECSKDMYDAFSNVKQYRGKPQWILPSFCLTHKPTKNDVFVFEKFEGQAFDKLKNNSSKILGAKCMLTCMSAGATIPPGTSPIFTEGMRDLIVCCTGFDLQTKQLLREKVEYMGGFFEYTLRSITTHVLAHNNITPKAVEAYKARKPIMTKEWVDAVWKRSLDANIRGGDKEFDKYISPLFHNLKITTTGIVKRKKDKLKDLISQHGGTFEGTLQMHSTDILLIETATGEKYRAAQSWKVDCVKPSWVHQCVELQRIVPLTEHRLEDKKSKASTPNKDEVTFSENFSMVSAIEHEERNFTHLEETASSQLSAMPQPPIPSVAMSALSETIDKIALLASDAELFLDGCNIYLSGFNQLLLEKLKKILNIGGATRFDELTRAVTHIIVADTYSESFKESGAYILPLTWLYQSTLLKKPAPVEEFLLNSGKTSFAAPPSPLSKQSARLLSRPEPRSLHFELEAEPAFDPPEDDLVNRYNLSQQGEPITERINLQNVTPLPSSSVTSCRSELSQTSKELLKGLKFFLSRDLSEDELERCESLIVEAGGFVATRKFSGVPDYAIVPITGAALPEITALEVVTLLFIKECFLEKRVVTVQYYHLPITWVQGSAPLKGCVISVSKYVDSERDFIETLIETLGAIVQDILAKKQKNEILQTTHLVCATPSGKKFEGALRWGLPVVHHNWLLKCAETGLRMPEEPYLLSETEVLSRLVANETHPTPASSAKKVNSNLISTESTTISNTANLNTESPLPRTNREVPNTSNSVSVLKPISENERVLTPRKIPLELSKSRVTPGTHSQSFGNSTPVVSRNPVCEAAGTPVNKAIERLKHKETPKGCTSPDTNRTITPTSPYGACYGNDNPSPSTRKRLNKWMNQGANFEVDPPAKRHDSGRRDSTPISDLISRQLRLMTRRPEEQPPDDSPDISTAKRLNFNETDSQTVKNDVITGLQKMKEIEESYSRTNVVIPSPVVISEEPRVHIVTESQPHTEIGWEDPSEREIASGGIEKTSDKVVEKPVKCFMFSALSESSGTAKEIIEKYGGKVSSLTVFDSNATHLIGASHMTRAEKLMGSIAAGLWILHPSYLEKLRVVKDIYDVKEEDYEWGNPKNSFPLDSLSKNVKECVISGYHWRCDIQIGIPPPFSGMQLILNTAPSKSEIFTRLFKAGKGTIININSLDSGSNCDKVYCICEMTSPAKALMETMAKKGIRCVTTLFVSDVILRKPTAAQDNLVPEYDEIWQQYLNCRLNS